MKVNYATTQTPFAFGWGREPSESRPFPSTNMKTSASLLLSAVLTCCSCNSLTFHNEPSSPNHQVRLSALCDTSISFDASRNNGIRLSILNDLNSDVFLLEDACVSEFTSGPITTQDSFRLPDLDERVRQRIESYKQRNLETFAADWFTFVWSGHTTAHDVYTKDYSPGRPYLSITYYNCNEKTFCRRSLRIDDVKKEAATTMKGPTMQRTDTGTRR